MEEQEMINEAVDKMGVWMEVGLRADMLFFFNLIHAAKYILKSGL